MTNREFIVKSLQSGQRVVRYTTAAAIVYKKFGNGVLRSRHADNGKRASSVIPFQVAVNQLTRNFKEVISC